MDSGNLKKAIWVAFLTLVIFSIIYSITINAIYTSGEDNLYNHQAQAFLNGQIAIPEYHFDEVVFKDKYYVPFPPFPTLLLMPLVWLVGIKFAKTIIISLILTWVNIIILKKILKKLNIKEDLIPWLVSAFLLGTVYWFCITFGGGVWFFAHIVAVTFMFLAINEGLGQGRGWLIGLFLGASFLSRQLMIYSAIFILTLIWENTNLTNKKEKIINCILFLAIFGFAVLFYMLFNYLRFENMFDTGYNYYILNGLLKLRVETYGNFNLNYVLYNFLQMFFQGFSFSFNSPGYLNNIELNPFGTSLTFASPFLFAAFLAKWKKSILYSAWISIGLTLINLLFYYNNGWIQYNGIRFALDFLPILFILFALGINPSNEKLVKGLIVYAIILNCLSFAIFPIINIITRIVIKSPI